MYTYIVTRETIVVRGEAPRAAPVHVPLSLWYMYQIHSVNRYLMVRGIFQWSFCVRRGCLSLCCIVINRF